VWRELLGSRELLFNLVSRDVKGKYKRTALGQLWSLANPVAQMLVYTAVFSIVMKAQPDKGSPSGLNTFALWLMCGLLPWTFFANVLGGGMSSLVGSESLIKKVWFPRVVIPVANTLSLASTWLVEMGVLVAALLIFGGRPLVWIPIALVAMAVLTLFATGISLALSVLNVYFRDVQHFMGIVMQVWFYATPIVYPGSYVAKHLGDAALGGVPLWDLYRLNPLERFVEIFRNLLYDNRLPAAGSVAWVLGWTVASLLIGTWTFARHERRLAEVL
jgi:ABC-2 type transport system permease protein